MSLSEVARRDLLIALQAALRDWSEMWRHHHADVPPQYGAVVELLATAHEHLEAITQLTSSPQIEDAAVIALARFAIECSARAWWIVEADDSDDRFVRLLLESRYAADQSSRMLKDFGSELPEPARQVIEMRIKSIELYLAQQSDEGWEISRSSIQGQKRPFLGEVLKHFAKEVSEERFGKITYHMTSAVAHGQRSGVDMLGDFDPSLARRIRLAQPAYGEVTPTIVGFALVSFDSAVRRVADVFGWGTDAFGSTLHSPLAVLRSRTAYAFTSPQLRRNDKCGCGSNRKFKDCHGSVR